MTYDQFNTFVVFFCELYVAHRDLLVLTHSFPTRRSSYLASAPRASTSTASSWSSSSLPGSSHSSTSTTGTCPRRSRTPAAGPPVTRLHASPTTPSRWDRRWAPTWPTGEP